MKKQEKNKEFNRLSKASLAQTRMEKMEALRQLRFDLEAGKIKNVRALRETKKDIARIETILNLKAKETKP